MKKATKLTKEVNRGDIGDTPKIKSLSAMAKLDGSFKLLQVNIGKKAFTIDLAEELSIDIDNVTHQLQKVPISYAYLASLYRKAKLEATIAEQHRKRLHAKLYMKYKSPEGGGRGPNEELVKSKVQQNHEYQQAVTNVILAESTKDTLEGLLKAYEYKKDLIQTISANLRNEKKAYGA